MVKLKLEKAFNSQSVDRLKEDYSALEGCKKLQPFLFMLYLISKVLKLCLPFFYQKINL